MAEPPTYSDISYASVRAFWDEIVLASAARFKTDPTRAHAMAVAIYVSQLLDWVFHEQHRREDTVGNPVYVAFRQRHHRACPELDWLADLSNVARRRGLGREVRLKRREGGDTQDASAVVIELGDGTRHAFDAVVDKVVAYWQQQL
jgi:hypothetical protein